MNLHMMSVRDRTAGYYFPPFFVRSKIEAARMFAKMLDDPNRSGKADEYDLFVLGSFDDQLCVVELLPVPTLICNGAQPIPGGAGQ